MSDLDVGQATIVYDHPEEGRIEETVDNEQVVYVRDHWAIRTGTDEDGNDLMRQVPKERVHYVERNVERFEEQAQTMRRRVGSVASDLRELLPAALVGDEESTDRTDGEPTRISIDEAGTSENG